jgi:hypothetical protein
MRTKTEREAKIAECRKSGLTATEWCTRNGISYNTYAGWVYKAKKASENKEQLRSGWVELKITDDEKKPDSESRHQESEQRIVISYGDWRISVPPFTSETELSKTLRAVSRT